jgi:replication-associated recombination protein RarA
MYAETFRPDSLDDVIGHQEAKNSLRAYLGTSGFPKAVMLTGPPGIGKTTLALASAKTMGFYPLEINASRSIRSYEDVTRIKDACRSTVNIHSFMRGDRNHVTCVILDEVDGSDPHAQGKIVDWIRDPTRRVPIICTGNELPTIFKRNTDAIEIIRCFPPRASDIQVLFDTDITDTLKDCQHDIRKLIHRMQYGISDALPKLVVPPTGLSVEKAFMMRQEMFHLEDSLREYRVYKPDTEPIVKASSQYTRGGKNVHTAESDTPHPKSHPGKPRSFQSLKADPPRRR